MGKVAVMGSGTNRTKCKKRRLNTRVALMTMAALLVASGCGCSADAPESGAIALAFESAVQAMEGTEVEWPPSEAVVVRLTLAAEGVSAVSQDFYDLQAGSYLMADLATGSDRVLIVELLDAGDWVIWHGRQDGITIEAGHSTSTAVSMVPSPSSTATISGATGIDIEGGASQTGQRNVLLTLAANQAESVVLSNSEGFLTLVTMPFSETMEWQLTQGPDGTRTVYARFVDDQGYSSRTVSASILYDTQAPGGAEVQFESNSVALLADGTEVKTTGRQAVSALLFVKDASEMLVSLSSNGGDVSLYQVSAETQGGEGYNSIPLGQWVPLASRVEIVLSPHHEVHMLEVQFRDRAGNTAEGADDTILLVPPEVHPVLSSALPLSPGCNPPETEAGWASPAAELIVSGHADPDAVLADAFLTWTSSSEPTAQVSPSVAAQLDLTEGILSGILDLPDDVPHDASLSLIAVVSVTDVYGPRLSDVGSSVSEELLVDRISPVIESFEVVEDPPGQAVVAADATLTGACTASLVQKGVGGGITSLVSDDSVSFSLALPQYGETAEVVLTATDAAGNATQQQEEVALLAGKKPSVSGLQMLPVVEPPFGQPALKPGDVVEVTGQVVVEPGSQPGELPLIGAQVSSLAWTVNGGADTVVADLDGVAVLANGQLSGTLVVPSGDLFAGPVSDIALQVKVRAPWDNESDPVSTEEIPYFPNPPVLVAQWAAAGCVNQPTVELELETVGASHVRFGGDVEPQFTEWAEVQPEVPTVAFQLTFGAGAKNVMVEVANLAGTTTGDSSVLTFHPELSPVQVSVNPQSSQATQGPQGTWYVNQPAVPLLFSYEDLSCAPIEVAVLQDPAYPGSLKQEESFGLVLNKWIELAPGTDGERGFRVRLSDSAGNTSEDHVIAVTLDTQPPLEPSLAFPQSKQEFLDVCEPVLTIGVSGQQEEHLSYLLLGDVVDPLKTWTPLPESAEGPVEVPILLSDDLCHDGSHPTVIVKLADIAGNESPPASLQVELNLTPPQTPLLAESALFDQGVATSKETLFLLRLDTQDPDFAGVERVLCQWCVAGEPSQCDCLGLGTTPDKLLAFPMTSQADADYLACIRAVDLFGLTGEWNCLDVMYDSTPPVSRIECWKDADGDGEPQPGEFAPCDGVRLPRNQLLTVAVGERNIPEKAAIHYSGVLAGTEAEGNVYDGTPFTYDSPAPLAVWATDAAGNTEVPQTIRLSFEFDHQEMLSPLGPFVRGTVTRLKDGNLLAIGGSAGMGSTLDRYAVLSPASLDAIHDGQDELAQSEEHAAVSLPDGRVVALGGLVRSQDSLSPPEFLDQMRFFDANGHPEQWAAQPFEPRIGHALALSGDTLVVSGGVDEEGVVLEDVTLLDAANLTQTTAWSTGVARREHTATVLSDGRVLLSGGFGQDDNAILSMTIIDPQLPGESTIVGGDAVARGGHTATLLPGDQIMFAGGLSQYVPDDLAALAVDYMLDSVQVITAEGVTIAQAEGILPGSVGHAALLLDSDRVLFSGGIGPQGVGRAAMILDSECMVRATIDNIGAPRAWHHGMLVDEERVVLVGGGTHSVLELDEELSILQRDAGVSVLDKELPTMRFGHRSALMPDGKILLVGGYSTIGNADDVSVVRPDGKTELVAPNELFGRHHANVVALPDGNVLLLGGRRIDIDALEEVLPGSDPEPYSQFNHPNSAVVFNGQGQIVQGPIEHPLFKRMNSKLLVLDRSRLLVSGGRGSTSDPYLDDLLVLELEDGHRLLLDEQGEPVVHENPGIVPPRGYHTLLRLDDGRVLLAGGCNGVGGNFADACNDSYVLSVDDGGGVSLEQVVDDIGGSRCHQSSSMVGGGDVLLAGGRVQSKLPDPRASTAVILHGHGIEAGSVKVPTFELGSSFYRHEQVQLYSGAALVVGGRVPEEASSAVGLDELNETAVIVTAEGLISQRFFFTTHGASRYSLDILPDGTVMRLGGTMGSVIASGTGGIPVGRPVVLSSLTWGTPPGTLWFGAGLTDTTSPEDFGVVNRHNPPANCTDGHEQSGWDKTYRLTVGDDQNLFITATPLAPEFDLSVYVVMMHAARNGLVCYAGADQHGPGIAETLQFSSALPEGRGAGTYYVVVDSPMQNQGGAFHIQVYGHPSEKLTFEPGGEP